MLYGNEFLTFIGGFVYDALSINDWNTFDISQILKNGDYVLSATVNGKTYPDEINSQICKNDRFF